MRLLWAIGFSCLLGGCGVSPVQQPAGTLPDAAPAHLAGFSALVASRSAAVVDISTLRLARNQSADDIDREIAPEIDFADRLAWPLPAGLSLDQIRDLASGVILTSDGLILTSAHLIADIDEAQVRLGDGRRFTPEVVGIDKHTDVALLKIEASGLPVAIIGDSSRLAPGDWVAAISAPFGFHGSVTTGVVSAKNRFIAGAGEIPFIQTDVAINPGSSGSPLFNSRGEVVAINSMIYSGNGGYMGLSFAVPINLAMKIATQLRTAGRVRRAHLGAEFQEMTPDLARSFALPQATGALVVRVDAGSPAQAAGLLRGDIVTAFEDARISHFTELLQLIADRAPGTRSRLDVWRHGTKGALWATLAEQPAAKAVSRHGLAPEWSDGLGLSLGELSAAQRSQLRTDAGLLVRQATGAARSEGIRAGDLIVAINDVRLERVEDFTRMLSRMLPGRALALLVMRDRRLAYVPLPHSRAAGQSIKLMAAAGCGAHRFQCAIRTGTVMCARMSRVTPPSSNSRKRACP